MSNKIVTVILLTLVINISIGLMTKLPGFESIDDSGIESDSSLKSGLYYNASYAVDLEEELTTKVNPTSADSSGFSFSSVLDFFSLGFIKRLVDAIERYAYGLNTLVLRPIFEPAISSYSKPLAAIIFNGINTIITILYGIGIFWLWTGKDVIRQ